jgi:hypothetical protein
LFICWIDIPSTHSSGGITYHGKITKTGSKYLRWIMVECVRSHIRTQPNNSNIRKFYYILAKKKGNAKATVAASSKLLKIVYWIMKEKREYSHIHNNNNNNNNNNNDKIKKELIDYYG